MSLIRACSVSLLLVGMMAGCSKEPANSADMATPATPVVAETPATAAPTMEMAPVAEAPVATAAVTGIADCDDFLNAYEQCVTNKIPESARAQMQTGMDQWRSAWKQMADNSATRDALPGICKQARDATAPGMKAYGCDL